MPADAHGCPACPHPAVGPAVAGSPNVLVNSLPALRVGDKGVHAACCGPNTWTASAGAPTVFINGLEAHRLDDADDHRGGAGKLIEGSPNVFVGDFSGSGPTEGEDPKGPVALALEIVDPFGNPMVRTLLNATVRVEGAERKTLRGFTAIAIGVEEGESAEIELFGPHGPEPP